MNSYTVRKIANGFIVSGGQMVPGATNERFFATWEEVSTFLATEFAK